MKNAKLLSSLRTFLSLLLCLALLAGCVQIPLKESTDAPVTEAPGTEAPGTETPKETESVPETTAAAESGTAEPSSSQPETTPAESTPAETSVPAGFEVVLCGSPVKTLYLAGERYETAGWYVSVAEGDRTYLDASLAAPEEPLTADTETVVLSWQGEGLPTPVLFSVPVTVLPGEGKAAFTSRVSETDYQSALRQLQASTEAEVLPNREGEAFPVLTPLSNPCSDGHVKSLEELADYVDYHAFYGISSVVVYLDYPYADVEEELDALYFHSGLLAGMASLELHDPGTGPLQILLRYYRDTLLNAFQPQTLGAYLTPARKESTRTAYASPRVRDDGVTVFTSDQAIYALQKGLAICPAAGSPAERLIERAGEILCEYGDDNWTGLEKLYHIFLFFMDNVVYDYTGDEAAAIIPDPELESDMLLAQLVSFHAEGPLLYGNSACYGFAKASALLLGLEGFSFTRLVKNDKDCVGRSLFNRSWGGYDLSIAAHSYLYVHLDGQDLIFDPTFSYAGNLNFACGYTTWFRSPSLCLSIQEHRQVYRNYPEDWYALSAAYRPGSGALMEAIRMEDGPSLLLQSADEFAVWSGALLAEAEASDAGAFLTTILISAEAMSRQEAQSAVEQLCGSLGSRFITSYYSPVYGEDSYYSFLIAVER